MLDQAAANDWVVIASDAKREFLRTRYSEKRGDWAVDPGLEICPRWATEREVRDSNEPRALAAGVFPDQPGELRFFRDWAEKILAQALDRYSATNAPKMENKEPADTRNLARWLRSPKTHLVPRLGAGILGAMNPSSGDQSAGMEGMLARAADGFAMMPMDSAREFCIREWIEKLNRGEQPGWIFFPTGGPAEKAVKPVVTAMIDMLLLRLRDATALGANRRQVLAILDEVTTSFNYLEQLKTALTNLRSFGVMVVGVHDQGSLDATYGHNSAKTIAGQAGIKLVSATDEPESQEYASKCIGNEEVWRLSENFPARVFDKHRSANFGLQVVSTPLVSPGEISALRPLDGYLVHRGFVTAVKLPYRPSPGHVREFEECIIPCMVDDEDPKLAESSPTKTGTTLTVAIAPVDDKRPAPSVAKPLKIGKTSGRNPMLRRGAKQEPQ
jgi:type IV secretory pathway TraG/TraD family ATPase VirD4